MSRLGRVLDLWSEWRDDDPAIIRGRGPRPVTDGPGESNAPGVAPMSIPTPPPSLDVAEKRARIEAFVARIQAGDLTAVDELRRLLDGYSETR